MITIKELQLSQLSRIESIYRTCGKAMLAQGFDNWGNTYPPRAVIEADIQAGQLFGLWEEDSLCGLVTLNEEQPVQFKRVNWQFPTQKVLIVRRLAVSVDQQGKGLAKKIMGFAEKYAQKEGFEAIRLDAYSINAPLLKFYENLGYQRTKEAIYLGANLKHPFICFEKKI